MLFLVSEAAVLVASKINLRYSFTISRVPRRLHLPPLLLDVVVLVLVLVSGTIGHFSSQPTRRMWSPSRRPGTCTCPC